MNDSVACGFFTLETELGRGDQGKSVAKFYKSIFDTGFENFT